MKLVVCDVRVTTDGREVCVTEVLGDESCVAGRLAQPRRGCVAQRVCGARLIDRLREGLAPAGPSY